MSRFARVAHAVGFVVAASGLLFAPAASGGTVLLTGSMSGFSSHTTTANLTHELTFSLVWTERSMMPFEQPVRTAFGGFYSLVDGAIGKYAMRPSDDPGGFRDFIRSVRSSSFDYDDVMYVSFHHPNGASGGGLSLDSSSFELFKHARITLIEFDFTRLDITYADRTLSGLPALQTSVSYAGSVRFYGTVTPAPAPVAMVGAGLGLLGSVRRRRESAR